MLLVDFNFAKVSNFGKVCIYKWTKDGASRTGR